MSQCVDFMTTLQSKHEIDNNLLSILMVQCADVIPMLASHIDKALFINKRFALNKMFQINTSLLYLTARVK